jgi:uncharacterized membrane protein YeaQ/YmgE (transglycosylase-associated protein family)
MLLADFVLPPASVAAWLVAGLIFGWLAGKVAENPSYGTMGDLLLGSIGAIVCGASWGFFVTGDPVFWVALVMACIGACVVIVLGRVIAARLSA